MIVMGVNRYCVPVKKLGSTGRRKARQKTVRTPVGLTPKQREKWLDEQATLFELELREDPEAIKRDITLAAYTELWARDVAPGKLAVSTLMREKQDVNRFLPTSGNTSSRSFVPSTSASSTPSCGKRRTSTTESRSPKRR